MGDARIRQWLDSGLVAHRQGDVGRAIQAYRSALTLAPEDGDALNLLGTGLLELGDSSAAVIYLERAARKQRTNVGVLANLAQAYFSCERYSDAADTYRKAARMAPQEPHFQLGLAGALAMQGKIEEALPLLKRLADRHPHLAQVWFNLGNAFRDRRQPEEAIAAYRRAVAIEPNYADAVNNLGSVYQSTLRFAEAEAQYRKTLAIAPDHVQARYNLASVVMDLGRFDEAETIARELLKRMPEWVMAYAALGAALGHQGRLLEARECQERAIAIAPDDRKTLESYAATLIETGRPLEGLRCFSRALAMGGDDEAIRQIRGTALLAHGALQDGWIDYQVRPAALRFREKYPDLDLAYRLPRDLEGRHVCVLREQGLGDEIFFLRYASVLANRGARVTYRASNKIAPLLERTQFISALVEEMSPLPPADFNILIGDLPHALCVLEASPIEDRPTGASAMLPEIAARICIFWPPVPPTIQLEPLALRAAEIRERLSTLGPPPYIGVTWRAGTAPEEQTSITWALYKTVPLGDLAATLRNTEATVLALQRKPGAGEIAAFQAALGRQVHDLTAFNEDLEGMLALLALIDDYVTVSNTNVHLRAAVGKTARVLVPAPAEWRWRQSGAESQWFPGSPVYRQSLQGDWAPALAALRRDLELSYPRAPRTESV